MSRSLVSISFCRGWVNSEYIVKIEFPSRFPALFSGSTPGTGGNAGPGTLQAGNSVWPGFVAMEPDRQVRVLLVDDDPHIRCVVAGELLADRRIDLVGQAGGVREGRKLLSRHDFDVLIVDLHLGDGLGFELIEEARLRNPSAEIVVVSIMDDDWRALRAFELGATGYLVKNAWFGSFAQAVIQVFTGGAVITPNLARRLLQRMERPPERLQLPASLPGSGELEPLSDRERDVLRLVSFGHTNAEVADALVLSVQTVNTHLRNVYRKLHVKSRVQAVNVANQYRLL